MADSTFEETLLLEGPSFHLEFAPIDGRHMLHFARRLIIFRCTSAAQRDAQLAAFKTGLKALLLRCPLLAGVVVPSNEKEDWRTIVPGQGLELVVKDLRKSIPTLDELEATNFPPHHFPWDLVMPISRDLSNDRPHAAAKMQFSAFEGGTILTLAISHSVGDGGGMDMLTRTLLDATRLAQEASSTIAPSGELLGIDRSLLCNIKSDLEFKFEQHPAYRLRSAAPLTVPGANTFGSTSSEIPILLRISANGLAQLKEDATTPGARISTHDALAALMWRTIMRVRHDRSSAAQSIPLSTTSNIFMPTNARHHLNLPPSYVGNVVYQLIAGLDLDTLFSPSGLQRAALEVRRAITAITPELVGSYFAYLTDDASSRAIDYQFMNGTAGTTGFAMGTCFGSTPVLYGGDWGKAFGPVVAYRLPGDATNVVMPKLPNGVAEVVLSMLPEEEEVVRGIEGFGKYLAL
ncbi:hypothetical protein C8F04DRAFT_1111167 [Mycena alexandri]|uniref:BAHD acyltransferase n=1 Tax=Mycena alexandri TaxID=1745969 RepID=A0AAD6WZX2_9AGAR|nr:hypothetical protein C8F04DRAFT_1113339 [Mycena alexandri]KAJ7031417.1 hypothetical protein C8F04DRAFT_1111167 [Mycena alexandri]